MSAATQFSCMTSTSSGVEPSLASHYITRQQLVTDGGAENDSPSGLISHKKCAVLPKEFKKQLHAESFITCYFNTGAKHGLCQSHTESGAVESINQTSHLILNSSLMHLTNFLYPDQHFINQTRRSLAN